MNRRMLPAASLLAAGAIAATVACSDRSGSPVPTATDDATQLVATSTATATGTGAAPTSTATAAGEDLSVQDLVKLAEPSIVRIETGNGVGSGFIVSEEGYLITNNHVVEGNNGQAQPTVQVTLSDGTELSGRVVGTDPRADLALVKIDGGPFKPLPLADQDEVEIGQDVVAIGYALDLDRGEGPSYSVTRGIVSQKNRAISETAQILGAIQTDAAINHGNSGGPLLNLKGEVVGVNTSLVPDTATGGVALGIGLAVGSDTVRAVLEELRETGAVSRGLLGIRTFEALRPAQARELGIPEDVGGVSLQEPGSVDPTGPSARAGMQDGDVIVSIDGAPISDETDLAVQMIRSEPGETVAVEVYRNGQKVTLEVTLGDASAQ